MNNRKELLASLFVSNFLLFAGFSLWGALFNNFAVEELSLDALNVGFIQSIREIPGLLGVGVGLLALLFRETKILSVSMIMLGAGLLWTSSVSGFYTLAGATLLFSFGFHYFAAANTSVVLAITEKKEAGKMLSRFSGLRSCAAAFSALFVIFFVSAIGYRMVFRLAGLMIVLAGCYVFLKCGFITAVKKKSFRLRKKYWLYYSLTFFGGCRRHIFTTFAIFLLVKEFGSSAETIALLFLVNSLVTTVTNWFFAGRLIDRFGERFILTADYLLLVFVFIGYAFIRNIAVLYALFVFDAVLFGFNIAQSTYLHKIADENDMTSNISMGQSINHIAAVITPVVGGLIWASFGYRFTFFTGVVIAVVSLVLCRFIKSKEALL